MTASGLSSTHLGASSSDVAPSLSPWIRSPIWDSFWVLGGFWLLGLAWLLGAGVRDPTLGPLDTVYFGMTAAFWLGHRISSAFVAFCTPSYQPLLRLQRGRFVGAPIAIASLVFLYFLVPTSLFPATPVERAMGLAILDIGLVSYHFASQHFGLLSLYRLRSGQPRSTSARRLDRVFALGVGVAVLVAQTLAGALAFQKLWPGPIADADWLAQARHTVGRVAEPLVSFATALLLVREGRAAHPSIPRALYIMALGAMAIAAFRVHFFLFFFAWTIQHWLAAIGLASLIAKQEAPDAGSRWYRAWAAVGKRGWTTVLVLAVVSTLLLPVLEETWWLASRKPYGFRLFPQLQSLLTNPILLPWISALAFSTAFIHYALDRATFRFSDQGVRKAARHLLMTP